MATGYPKFDNNGPNNVITLRVPRFTNYAFYDPTVEAGYQAGCTGLRTRLVVQCAVALISFVARAFC